MRPGRVLFAAALLAAGSCGQEQPETRNLSIDEVADQLSEMRIEPGLWELTSEVVDVRAPDLPIEVRSRMVGPRSRLRHCISPVQAARPSANFLAGRNDSACAYADFSVENGQVQGTMVCPDATARMQGRYGPRAYDMRMEMESPIERGATMTLQVRARGRRIGDCEQGGTE